MFSMVYVGAQRILIAPQIAPQAVILRPTTKKMVKRGANGVIIILRLRDATRTRLVNAAAILD